MTNPLTTLDDLPLPDARVPLSAGDAERIATATAIEAELAPTTRETYDNGWRQWERWCRGRGIDLLPAPPKALAAFLAERAEAELQNHPMVERIGPRAISRTVQERAKAAGFDGVPVSGHSLGTLLNHHIRPAEAMATTTSRDLGL